MSNAGFDAYEVAIAVIRELREPLAKVKQHDGKLADQMQRAGTSVALNVAEGRRRAGRDRVQLFRVALGSAGEVSAALDVAKAWGYVTGADVAKAEELLDRERAMLWRLTNRGA